MIPRSGRLLLWCLALLFSASLYVKGRVLPARGGENAALSHEVSGTVTVRLAEGFPRPGVYRFPDGTTLGAAIKMTVPNDGLSPDAWADGGRRLETGQRLDLVRDRRGTHRIMAGIMPVKEKMLLGIPLDPDLLQATDWELLPGIGPALSRRIVEDRHENGAFGTLDAVARVPGIGPKKLAAIRRYF